MDRLLREGNPPTGQLASPKPQYKKPGVDEYAPVEGQHGAPFATLKDASGNVVSPATEATLEQVRALLSGVATEAKLEQARVLLNTISNKDFATDAKLEQARVLLNSINSKDFATNAKLEEVRALLNTINGKDFATQAELVAVKQELQAIKNSLTDGTQKVTLSGTIVEEPVWVYEQVQLSTPPGAYSLIEVKASTGVWGTINYLGVYIPAIGGSTGKHKLTVAVGQSLVTSLQYSEAIPPIEVEAKNNLNLRVDRLAPLKDIIITDTRGVTFRYDNNSDTMQTNAVSIRGIILERRVKQ